MSLCKKTQAEGKRRAKSISLIKNNNKTMGIADNLEMSGSFISAKEFDEAPVTLKITKKAELVQCHDPKYGFQVGHEHVGKTIRYSFGRGTLDSTSVRLLNALTSSGADVGDYVSIKRDKDGTNTQYHVEKVKAPKDGDVVKKDDKDIPPFK